MMFVVDASTICAPSDDVVAREIEGELVIVPLVSGVGDVDDELYTLNETGRLIWAKLDGIATLGELALSLGNEFDSSLPAIESDVIGFATELLRRGILSTPGV